MISMLFGYDMKRHEDMSNLGSGEFGRTGGNHRVGDMLPIESIEKQKLICCITIVY